MRDRLLSRRSSVGPRWYRSPSCVAGQPADGQSVWWRIWGAGGKGRDDGADRCRGACVARVAAAGPSEAGEMRRRPVEDRPPGRDPNEPSDRGHRRHADPAGSPRGRGELLLRLTVGAPAGAGACDGLPTPAAPTGASKSAPRGPVCHEPRRLRLTMTSPPVTETLLDTLLDL